MRADVVMRLRPLGAAVLLAGLFSFAGVARGEVVVADLTGRPSANPPGTRVQLPVFFGSVFPVGTTINLPPGGAVQVACDELDLHVLRAPGLLPCRAPDGEPRRRRGSYIPLRSAERVGARVVEPRGLLREIRPRIVWEADAPGNSATLTLSGGGDHVTTLVKSRDVAFPWPDAPLKQDAHARYTLTVTTGDGTTGYSEIFQVADVETIALVDRRKRNVRNQKLPPRAMELLEAVVDEQYKFFVDAARTLENLAGTCEPKEQAVEIRLGRLYLDELDRPEDARKFLESGLSVAIRMRDVANQAEARELLARALEARGSDERTHAINHARRARALYRLRLADPDSVLRLTAQVARLRY